MCQLSPRSFSFRVDHHTPILTVQEPPPRSPSKVVRIPVSKYWRAMAAIECEGSYIGSLSVQLPELVKKPPLGPSIAASKA